MTTQESNEGSGTSFLDLPPEIRNNIYELVCTDFTNVNDSGEVNLLDAFPPNAKGLLLTCRQIYREARGIFRQSFRTFWSKTHFYIDQEEAINLGICYKEISESFRYHLPDPRYLVHINHVVLRARDTGYWANHKRGRNGAWKVDFGMEDEVGKNPVREYMRTYTDSSGAWAHSCHEATTLENVNAVEARAIAADAQAGELPDGLGLTASEIEYAILNMV